MRVFAVIALLALVAASCATTDEEVSPPATGEAPIPSTETTTTSAPPASSSGTSGQTGRARGRYVNGVVGDLQSVSPDGRLLLASDGERVCLQIAIGTEIVCAAWRDGGGGDLVQLIADWSPDGSSVVFFDRVETARDFMGPLWVFDIDRGSVDQLLDAEGTLGIDVAARDATTAFLGLRDTDSVTLSVVPNGGEAATLSDVSAGLIGWMPDGSSLLFTGFSEEWGGLWRIDGADGSTELITGTDEVLGRPALAGISADGAWALVQYRNFVAEQGFPAGVSHFGLVDLDSGDVSPLKEPTGADFVGPLMVAFSPDGASIAYTYNAGLDLEAPLFLAIRSVDDPAEQIISGDLFGDVGAPEVPLPLLFDPWLKPVWAERGLLILPTRAWVLLVTIE